MERKLFRNQQNPVPEKKPFRIRRSNNSMMHISTLHWCKCQTYRVQEFLSNSFADPDLSVERQPPEQSGQPHRIGNLRSLRHWIASTLRWEAKQATSNKNLPEIKKVPHVTDLHSEWYSADVCCLLDDTIVFFLCAVLPEKCLWSFTCFFAC